MTSHERSRQLTKVLGALVAEIRDELGHDVALKLWSAALKKGKNGQEDND